MRRLYAGPWIGEFGWELMGWQGVIRYLAPDFDKIIIFGQDGHEYLYEDFCTDFIPHDIKGKNPNMWMNDNSTFPNPLRNRGDVWITPQQMTLMQNPPMQDFKKYGEKTDDLSYDIVCHSRSIDKYGSTYVNYPMRDWLEIVNEFPNAKIASIGTLSGADYIMGTDDLRGISLGKLANVLASSKLLIGPSSGPIHYGSLCGIPHLVWSGYTRSKPRYEKLWNPLNTPVKVISPDSDPWGEKKEWKPEYREILKAISEGQWLS